MLGQLSIHETFYSPHAGSVKWNSVKNKNIVFVSLSVEEPTSFSGSLISPPQRGPWEPGCRRAWEQARDYLFIYSFYLFSYAMNTMIMLLRRKRQGEIYRKDFIAGKSQEA